MSGRQKAAATFPWQGHGVAMSKNSSRGLFKTTFIWRWQVISWQVFQGTVIRLKWPSLTGTKTSKTFSCDPTGSRSVTERLQVTERWRKIGGTEAILLYSSLLQSSSVLAPNSVWLQCAMWWTAFWFLSEFRVGWPRWHCAELLKWLVFLYQIICCWLAVLYSPLFTEEGISPCVRLYIPESPESTISVFTVSTVFRWMTVDTAQACSGRV